MKRTAAISLILFSLLFVCNLSIQAQTTTNSNEILRSSEDKKMVTGTTTKPVEKPQDFFQTGIKQTTTASPALKTLRPEVKKDIQETINLKRAEAKERFASKREDFAEKLKLFGDANKKQIVEKIDARLSDLNAEKTDEMAQAIKEYSALILRFQNRLNNVPLRGGNTTDAQRAIIKAQADLVAAENAVTVQAGKEYLINITTENTIKTAVIFVTKQLESDLKTTRITLQTARESLKKASAEVKKLNTVEEEKTSAPSSLIE